MANRTQRLLSERAIDGGGEKVDRPARSVTINMAESPLGWLFSRGFVSQRQFDAGERLRADWERSQLAPRVTMNWQAPRSCADAAVQPLSPISLAPRSMRDVGSTPLSPRRVPASPTSCGGWFAPARGCATPKAHWAGPRELASWC